jgi:hypothetical protein
MLAAGPRGTRKPARNTRIATALSDSVQIDRLRERSMHDFRVEIHQCSFPEWRPITRIYFIAQVMRAAGPRPLSSSARVTSIETGLADSVHIRIGWARAVHARTPWSFWNARFLIRRPITRTYLSVQVILATGRSSALRLCADCAHRDYFLGFRAYRSECARATNTRIPCVFQRMLFF